MSRHTSKRPIGRGLKVLLCTVACITLLVLVSALLLYPTPVHYDDMDVGIRTVAGEDGLIRFEYGISFEPIGGISHNGSTSKTVLIDYNSGIRYYYKYTYLVAPRWNLWFENGAILGEDPVLTPDGGDRRRPGWFGETDRPQHTKDDYLDNPDLLVSRYLRIYYENPDYTYVLLWEHPEAEEIIARAGIELGEPADYRIDFTHYKKRR